MRAILAWYVSWRMQTATRLTLGLWMALSGCGGAQPSSEATADQADGLEQAAARCRGVVREALRAKADGSTQNEVQRWCVDVQYDLSQGSDLDADRRLNVIVRFTGDGADLQRFGLDLRGAQRVYTREGGPASEEHEVRAPVRLADMNELAELEAVESIAAVPVVEPI